MRYETEPTDGSRETTTSSATHGFEETPLGAATGEIEALRTRDERAPAFGRGPVRTGEGAADLVAATRVSLRRADGALAGTVVVAAGRGSALESDFGVPAASLERTAVLEDLLTTADTTEAELAALLYGALRRARIFGLPTVAVIAAPDHPVVDVLRLEPLASVPAAAGLRVFAQRVDLAIHRAYDRAAPLAPALRALFVPEAVETLDRWIATFFATPWFRSIEDGTMTRAQYVYTLSNMHQFVRWTTRLIGRAVALSHDRELRNHWLKHLDGEINHELIIEKDLAALGADVDYVVRSMVPTVANQQFMVTQESMIGFHEDPVLFMAAPFVAEGFSARLDRKFMDALERTVKSWGVEQPRRATLFFASHIEYDGGDDGHWEMSRAILERYLDDEVKLQRFLNTERLAMEAFARSYAGYVDDLAIFSARSIAG